MNWPELRDVALWALWGASALVAAVLALLNYLLAVTWLVSGKDSRSYLPAFGTLAAVAAALLLWALPGEAPLWATLVVVFGAGSDAVPLFAQSLMPLRRRLGSHRKAQSGKKVPAALAATLIAAADNIRAVLGD